MSAIGLERVVSPAGVLPQAAERLDASAEIAPHEVRVRVERLNLDAASYRQLWGAHGGDGDAVRAAVLESSRRGRPPSHPATPPWPAPPRPPPPAARRRRPPPLPRTAAART